MYIYIWHFYSFENYAFVHDEEGQSNHDLSTSSAAVSTEERHQKDSFNSEYDLIERECINDDLSTADVLKLQLYEEIVQRFGPDEKFSEMLKEEEQHKNLSLMNSISQEHSPDDVDNELKNAEQRKETIEINIGEDYFSKRKCDMENIATNTNTVDDRPSAAAMPSPSVPGGNNKEDLEFNPIKKVEVLLVSHVPKTHRSSFHSVIIPGDNA